LQQWPTDPYELLGVGQPVAARDLKRAYTRLIRIYKPEQHPDEFQRIREAYETILRHVEWMQQFGGPESPAPPTVPEADAPATPMEESERLHAPRALVRSLHEELHAAWETACRGDTVTAYRQLVELHERNWNQQDPYLRLYWLLVLEPELDTARTPLDWLFMGLKATGLTGPLRELLRRELREQPEVAVSARCSELLELPVAPGALADIVDWRWEAASRFKNLPAIITDDLGVLRNRVAGEDEAVWVRIIVTAMNYLAWSPAHGLLQHCRELLSHCEHLHTRMPEDFDRVDYLMELAQAWRKLLRAEDVPAELIELIPLSWTRTVAEYRLRLVSFLERIAGDPHGVMSQFDVVYQNALPVLAQFGNVLNMYAYGSSVMQADPRTPEQRAAVARYYLKRADLSHYGRFRHDLLDFCLRESLQPEDIAAATGPEPEFWLSPDRHLAHALQDDWPLRHVCLAVRLFWM
jgi:hypothetical protein